MSVSIRAFDPADAPAMMDLHRRAILATPDRYYTAAERDSWAFGLTPEGYVKNAEAGEIFEIAVVGGQIVGFCGRLTENVQGLYVDPDHQGVGIGSILLERAETALRAGGVRVSEIEASLGAVPFYKAKAYRTVASKRVDSRGGLKMAVEIMRRAL